MFLITVPRKVTVPPQGIPRCHGNPAVSPLGGKVSTHEALLTPKCHLTVIKISEGLMKLSPLPFIPQ